MKAEPHRATNPQRAWQRMLSGRRLDLLQPSPADIDIEDIAHGLARVARWNGQTIGPHAFSVAQHSIVVTEIVAALVPDTTRQTLRAALLHDAAEYVIGDLISPFKAAIGLDYKAVENRLLDAIARRFEFTTVSTDTWQLIKDADRIAAYWEATQLAGFSADEAQLYFGHPTTPPSLIETLAKLDGWPAHVAQNSFLTHFDKVRDT